MIFPQILGHLNSLPYVSPTSNRFILLPVDESEIAGRVANSMEMILPFYFVIYYVTRFIQYLYLLS